MEHLSNTRSADDVQQLSLLQLPQQAHRILVLATLQPLSQLAQRGSLPVGPHPVQSSSQISRVLSASCDSLGVGWGGTHGMASGER